MCIRDSDSLFSWVHREWGLRRRGLLLCDDGGGEIADFLHLAPVDPNGEHELTLIHVKASKSADEKRFLSVGEYELVIAQAIKNLMHADLSSIETKLRRIDSHTHVWTNGVRGSTPSNFADELSRVQHKVQLRIVVIQPHALEHAYARASLGKGVRVKQLNTLLLEAQATCRNVGAGFAIYASASRPTNP